MPYEIQWERPFGVQVRHFGVVTEQDVAQVLEGVSSDEGFDELRYWMADFIDAEDHALDLRTPGRFESPFATLIGASHSNPYIHCAFVCTNPAVEDAIRLAIDRKLVPFEARIFREADAARDWLGAISGKFRILPSP